MAVTVVKNEGSDPSVRDSSTQLLLVGAANATLKFSELRLAFKEVSSGSVSASELFRNTNVDITLKSSHPAPATLRSMSWEGDYSPKYYRRV